MRPAFALSLAIVLLATAHPSRVRACVGSECFQLWSTEAGGGALTVEFDFSAKVQTFRSFCTGGNAQCLYSALDPGFIATPDAEPRDGFHPVADGTRVVLEVVAIADPLTIVINGNRLDDPGESATLGTFPDVHSHPSWQLLLPGDVHGDFVFAFRLRAEPATYAASETFAVTVTNVAPTPSAATPTATATATPTPVAPRCDGDCDASGDVTVDEVLTCVNQALGTSAGCDACDADGEAGVTVNEIIAAVNAALTGCGSEPAVTLAELQRNIFPPRCATPLCHDAATNAGELVLAEGVARANLVDVVPSAVIAAQAGQLRVDPTRPDNSFLLIKLVGPPLGAGGRMPLVGGFLSAEEIDAVRRWILDGALP